MLWTTNTGHHATSHAREFTLPGEWLRPNSMSTAETAVDLLPTEDLLPTDEEIIRDPGEKTACGPAAEGAEPSAGAPDLGGAVLDPLVDHQVVCGPVIIGPTVAGPTMPVIPAGVDYVEPNTELEDPDTIPHSGSAEIYPYRVLRQQARERSLRRLAGLRKLLDPPEQRKRDFIAGRQSGADGTVHNGADLDATTNEMATLTENLKTARLVQRSRRPASAVQQPTPDRLADPAHDAPETTDEPPF